MQRNASYGTEQDLGTQVVFTTTLGFPITRNDALRAFDAVQNPTNWKLPIDCAITLDRAIALGGLNAISGAVEFFTGSKAEFREEGNEIRVRAAGYYAVCGA
jgi:hypothetical protein